MNKNSFLGLKYIFLAFVVSETEAHELSPETFSAFSFFRSIIFCAEKIGNLWQLKTDQIILFLYEILNLAPSYLASQCTSSKIYKNQETQNTNCIQILNCIQIDINKVFPWDMNAYCIRNIYLIRYCCMACNNCLNYFTNVTSF